MTSPIRRHGGALTNLLTIPQKQEGREGNRWKGRRMASEGHNAHSLPPPPQPLDFRLPPSALLSLEQSTKCERAEAHNQSDNTVYKCCRTMEDNHKEFWEQGHGPSSARGGSCMPINSHRPAETDRCQRDSREGGGGEV